MARPYFHAVVLFLFVIVSVQIYFLVKKPEAFSADCSNCARIGRNGEDAVRSESASRPGRITTQARQRAQGGDRARAAIVILARNNDVDELNKTLSEFEERFNGRFEYPYVFLNDVPFGERFKQAIRQIIGVNRSVSFGTVPTDHWSYPSWINVTRADEARADMEKRNIIYGGSLSYRHMCRYNSGFFYRHPLLQEYDYYWRVEPGVRFLCDVDYDPFMYLKKHNKEYGFTIMIPEYLETVPTLWKTVERFMEKYPQYVHPKNSLKMFQEEEGEGKGGYNLCHFWSNFEIGSLKLFRSNAYSKYFEFLDREGGFFYERWGDAPVHSLGVALFLPKEKIHHFEDIGYLHQPYSNCPANPALQLRCNCDPQKCESRNNNCFNRYLRMYRE